jgi:hypothetical protein
VIGFLGRALTRVLKITLINMYSSILVCGSSSLVRECFKSAQNANEAGDLGSHSLELENEENERPQTVSRYNVFAHNLGKLLWGFCHASVTGFATKIAWCVLLEDAEKIAAVGLVPPDFLDP